MLFRSCTFTPCNTMFSAWQGISPRLRSLVAELRQCVIKQAPDLAPLYQIYANEALFGFCVIAKDLHHLSPGAQILEIGAGISLLSCHLQREGYAVTAVDPVGQGFSHLDRLRKIVLDFAKEGGFVPAALSVPAEKLECTSEFDFAFSINVMEHVADVALVIKCVFSAIKKGACYRFICPNYLFPYEPHFNIPILFSKAWTECLFRKLIYSSQRIINPVETWASLNWISVLKVRRICHSHLGVDPVFDRSVLYRFVQRSLHDSEFRSRRGSFILGLLQALDRLGMTQLLGRIPVVCQPAMDCVIVRK